MADRARAAIRYLIRRLGWSLEFSRHRIALHPMPRRNCAHCRGAGGWWVGGPFPEMVTCPCWSDRVSRRVRLLRVPGCDEHPF